jgi:uncharacterized membrane protein
MAFCSQCGTKVGDRDRFCPACGAQQPVSSVPDAKDPLAKLSPRTAAILCYVPMAGWIASLIVLTSARFRGNRDVRFHAFQGLYLFVAWLIVDQVLGFAFQGFPRGSFRPDKLLQAALFVTWIFMIVKTAQSETISLPVIGEMAQKSATES